MIVFNFPHNSSAWFALTNVQIFQFAQIVEDFVVDCANFISIKPQKLQILIKFKQIHLQNLNFIARDEHFT